MPNPITLADIDHRRQALAVAENRFNNTSGVLAVNGESLPGGPLTEYKVNTAIRSVNVAAFRLNSIVRRAKAQESRGLSLFCPSALEQATNRGKRC
jgi:ribosomal 30S subunit maturation factor RimM